MLRIISKMVNCHAEHMTFIGSQNGQWMEGNPIRGRFDWYLSVDPKNQRIDVFGATEHHPGFRQAFSEIVQQYNLQSYQCDFDGNKIQASELVNSEINPIEELTFYHGTSLLQWERIKKEGLKPRQDTQITPGYGASSSAPPSNPQLIYLTTQMGMARFAARDRAIADKSPPVIIEVRGLQKQYMLPDEDSRQQTAEASLHVMGSIAYARTIPPQNLMVYRRILIGR